MEEEIEISAESYLTNNSTSSTEHESYSGAHSFSSIEDSNNNASFSDETLSTENAHRECSPPIEYREYAFSECSSPEPENIFSECFTTTENMSHSASSYSDPSISSKESTQSQSNNLDSPLYPEAPISFHATLLLILAFLLSHNLTKNAADDLLTLIYMILPKPHNFPTSLYKFYKNLNIDVLEPIRHYYCQACQTLISNSEKICPNFSCQQESKEYFLELDLEHQVQRLFQRPHFYNQLQHRFTRKTSDRSIKDIYDGKLYRRLSEPGNVLSNPSNISLLWNTDGIPIFKSSNQSIWPLYFVINELPYQLRMKKQNILLGGLWFGASKPNMQLFLQPIVKVLSNLEINRTLVKVHGMTKPMTCKVIVLAGTCDLPAKSLILNIKQFNGFYGCPRCLHPGETFKLGPRSHTHVYPFQEHDPYGPPRTHEGMREDMKKTVETDKSVNGVLGPSWLGSLKYFDLAQGMAIDYIHCCLLGVARKMLRLMLDSKKS